MITMILNLSSLYSLGKSQFADVKYQTLTDFNPVGWIFPEKIIFFPILLYTPSEWAQGVASNEWLWLWSLTGFNLSWTP